MSRLPGRLCRSGFVSFSQDPIKYSCLFDVELQHGTKKTVVDKWLWVKTNILGQVPSFLVYFSGDWDVHWGYDLGFDPWLNLCIGGSPTGRISLSPPLPGRLLCAVSEPNVGDGADALGAVQLPIRIEGAVLIARKNRELTVNDTG